MASYQEILEKVSQSEKDKFLIKKREREQLKLLRKKFQTQEKN